jgi:dTDP-4-dehydrorhamnose 3,5-epimerase
LQIKPLKLEGTFEIIFNRHGDARGYFMEVYSKVQFAEAGLQINWIQENQSLSERPHTVRGLHLQAPPFAQTKFVRVVRGEILDVFVDLRKDSETFGQWDSVNLSDENCKAVYIPRGFAHGFSTLTSNVIVQYKVDNVYEPKSEMGIRWDDADIGIDWAAGEQPLLSPKDSNLPLFRDFISPF